MKRFPARKVPLYIFENATIAGDGFFTEYGLLRRVRVMGRAVSKFVNDEETYASVTIDDGTGTLRIKFFGDLVQKAKKIQLGDLIDVVGMVKLFKGEIYVNAEEFAILDDMNWELLRVLEIALQPPSKKEAILDYLRKSGPTRLEELEALMPNAKEVIEELKYEGLVFEPEKGVFAIVEVEEE